MEMYRKVYIKTIPDLPKEKGEYFACRKSDQRLISLDRFIDPDLVYENAVWLRTVDWYLQPIEITDADIEAWAEETLNLTRYKRYGKTYLAGILFGTKAMRDGLINHISK